MGLGNPEPRYANTRHNLGFRFVDILARHASDREDLRVHQIKADISGAAFQGLKLLLVKPLTYMNNSGEAVLAVKDRFESDLSKYILVYDDLDIPIGTVRLRKKGSAGTHRGMVSVVQALGSEDFPRLRLGIGPKPLNIPAEEFVLKGFGKTDEPLVEEMLLKAKVVVEAVLEKGIDYALSKGNG